MEIDPEEFCECDYGVLADNSSDAQKLATQLEVLAQAAIQTQTLDFSTIMKLYGSSSLAEKQRMVEANEKRNKEQQMQMQQQQIQQQQQAAQMQQQTEMARMEHEAMLNNNDNETKIIVAQIAASAKTLADSKDGIEVPMSESEREKLRENIRQFNAKLDLEKEKLSFEKDKARTDARLKEKQINSRPKTTKK